MNDLPRKNPNEILEIKIPEGDWDIDYLQKQQERLDNLKQQYGNAEIKKNHLRMEELQPRISELEEMIEARKRNIEGPLNRAA